MFSAHLNTQFVQKCTLDAPFISNIHLTWESVHNSLHSDAVLSIKLILL